MLRPLQALLQNVQTDPAWAEFRYLQRLRQCWPEIVGSAVAAQTEPLRIQQQVLQVATSTPAWAQNLALQRHLILSKLNPQLSRPLKDIRFLPGEWHRRPLATTKPHFEDWVERPTAIAPRPKTPAEAFERWAKKVKQSQLEMFPCPQCRRPAPESELKRWYVCGYCQRSRVDNRGDAGS